MTARASAHIDGRKRAGCVDLTCATESAPPPPVLGPPPPPPTPPPAPAASLSRQPYHARRRRDAGSYRLRRAGRAAFFPTAVGLRAPVRVGFVIGVVVAASGGKASDDRDLLSRSEHRARTAGRSPTDILDRARARTMARPSARQATGHPHVRDDGTQKRSAGAPARGGRQAALRDHPRSTYTSVVD